MTLREVCAATYAVLAEDRDADQLYSLDVQLGLVEETTFDERTAKSVPTTTDDPVAMTLLALFGESG